MTAEAKFTITAQDATQAAAKSALANMRALNSSIGTLTKGAKLLTIGFGGFSFGRFITEGLKASEASQGAVKALDRLTETAIDSRAAFAEILAPAIETAANWLSEGLPSAVDTARDGFEGLRSGILEFVADGSESLGAFYEIIAKPAWGDLETTYLDAAKSAHAFAAEIRDLKTVYQEEAANRPAFKRMATPTKPKERTAHGDSLKEYEVTGAAATHLFGDAIPFERYVDMLQDAKSRTDALFADSDKGMAELLHGSLSTISDDLELVAGKTFETTDAMSEFAKSAAQNMQSHLAQFFLDPAEEGFRGLAKGFVDSLRQMAAEVASTKLLEGLMGKDGTSGLIGGFISGLFGGMKASGGPVSSGKGYIVGEQGPEWFMPGSSGSIVPNGALAGAGAPINITTHIDARGATSDLIGALPGILKRNNDAVKADIIEGLRRKRYAGV